MIVTKIRVLIVETEKLFLELRGCNIKPNVKLHIKEPVEVSIQELQSVISAAMAEWHNGRWDR